MAPFPEGRGRGHGWRRTPDPPASGPRRARCRPTRAHSASLAGTIGRTALGRAPLQGHTGHSPPASLCRETRDVWPRSRSTVRASANDPVKHAWRNTAELVRIPEAGLQPCLQERSGTGRSSSVGSTTPRMSPGSSSFPPYASCSGHHTLEMGLPSCFCSAFRRQLRPTAPDRQGDLGGIPCSTDFKSESSGFGIWIFAHRTERNEPVCPSAGVPALVAPHYPNLRTRQPCTSSAFRS